MLTKYWYNIGPPFVPLADHNCYYNIAHLIYLGSIEISESEEFISTTIIYIIFSIMDTHQSTFMYDSKYLFKDINLTSTVTLVTLIHE